MTGAGLTHAEHVRRRDIADAVIIDGGTMADFSRRIGLTPAGGLLWLRTYEPDLHKALIDGHRRGHLSAHVALCRLLLIREARAAYGYARPVARALGLTSASLSLFVRRWAPRGIDQAIADLWPDDDPPDAPLERNGPWTRGEVKALRGLHGQGFTFTDIAERLHRPRGSCITKANALDLPERDRSEQGRKGYDRAQRDFAEAHAGANA